MNFQIVSFTAPHVTLLLASMLWHPNIRTKVGSVVDASELAKLAKLTPDTRFLALVRAWSSVHCLLLGVAC